MSVVANQIHEIKFRFTRSSTCDVTFRLSGRTPDAAEGRAIDLFWTKCMGRNGPREFDSIFPAVGHVPSATITNEKTSCELRRDGLAQSHHELIGADS